MFTSLSQKFSAAFGRLFAQRMLSETDVNQCLTQVVEALVEADVPYAVAQFFTEDIRKEIVGKQLMRGLQPAEQVMKLVQDRLVHFLGGVVSQQMNFSFTLPSICMVMGLQGSGKTTTIAKLARYHRSQAEKQGKKRTILLGSVDFYRPAAVEQLRILAEQCGVGFYQSSHSNPVAAASDIVSYGKQQGYEMIFIDTAGRLHTDEPLIEELIAIDRSIRPTIKVLVVDSMMGQQSLAVATTFHERVGFQAGIVTKIDSDTKGGVAFAFTYLLHKPILFLGTGEQLDGLEAFRAERIAQRLLDLGDMRSLVERAEEKIKKSEQERFAQTLKRGTLTLQDFADQMNMIGQLGSLQTLVAYLPGMSKLSIPDRAIEQGERDMKKWKAIIYGMTPRERLMPKILDGSRKKRIAQGSGVGVADVNALLDRFEQCQQCVRMFKQMKFFNS